MSEDEAVEWAQKLLQLAQLALVHSDYTQSPTLATVQSVFLLIYFLLGNAWAPSSVTPALGLLGHWCQSLGVHLIDSRMTVKRRQHQQPDFVDLEAKRRLWSYICSTDW